MQSLVVTVVLLAVAALVASWAYGKLVAVVTVYEYQRGLKYDRGRFVGEVGPGRYRLLRRRTEIRPVDVRPRIVTVPGQEVITSDGVSVRISLLLTYSIVDAATAVNSHSDFGSAIYARLQAALRDAVAMVEIDALLEQRATIGAGLKDGATEEAAELGVVLESVEIKDVMLAGELRRAFAQVVTARKEGLAALERARGETAALRNLANAARLASDSPALMQLRLLQELGRSGGNTVVLGFPASSTPLPLRESHAEIEAPEPPAAE